MEAPASSAKTSAPVHCCSRQAGGEPAAGEALALGVDPTACLVIEDAPAGIHSGRASGAFVVAVATSHPRQALSDADLVIEDLRACQVTSTDSGLHVTVEVPTHRPDRIGNQPARLGPTIGRAIIGMMGRRLP